MERLRGLVFHIPEATAATPIEGTAIINRWWTVHPEKGLAFYATRKRSYELEPGEQEEPSPQCNSNEYTARHLQQKLYPDCETRLIPVVFMQHAVKEMHRLRRAALSSTMERRP